MSIQEQEKFIRRTIRETLEKLRGRFRKDIIEKKLRMTDYLLDTVEGRGKDIFNYSENNGTHTIELIFPDYGRQLDMRYYQKRQYYQTPGANRELYGIKKKKRDTRWYSKNVYPWLAELQWELRYGFTEEVKAIGQQDEK